jgi:small multidrug resistance pump/quaternary ammonium compound-resistance protein SugE
MVTGTALVQLVLASVCFAVGGMFMKLSAGASRPVPTAAFLALFVLGAVLQAFALRKADLGVVYIAVLGLEAVLTFGFSVLLFRESFSLARVTAVLLIVAGVVLLRRT